MARQTLLQMTQNVLSALNSDEVNSISDTTEALQVATIIQNKFYDIASRGDLPKHEILFQLDSSNDGTKPTLMFVPDGISKLEWIKYFDSNVLDGAPEDDGFSHDLNVDITDTTDTNPNAAPGFQYVTVLPIDQFLDMINRFNPEDDDVESFVFTESGRNFTFYYKNDHQPQYCTVISNNYVIFDMFDNTQDSTLQASKTLCWGQTVPVFSLTDSFIPELDDQQFPLLLNEAKSLAFYELKQQPHMKADQEIKRQWSSVQKNKAVSDKPTAFQQLPDFGRVPRTGGFSGGYGANRWMREGS